MNKLAIMDYCTGTIDIYKIESSIQHEDIERKLVELGYDPYACYYMVSDNLEVQYIDKVL